MNIGELIEILNKYPKETDIKVLEKTRRCGSGYLANIVSVREGVNMDTNKIGLAIETDFEGNLKDNENKEEVTYPEVEENVKSEDLLDGEREENYKSK